VIIRSGREREYVRSLGSSNPSPSVSAQTPLTQAACGLLDLWQT
jgi:hypothetical protein